MYNDNFGIKGTLTIKEICKSSGKTISEYTDENVITDLGISTVFLRMVLMDADATMVLRNFFLGIDYGEEEEPGAGWTMLNPKPAEKSFNSMNQYVVYEVPEVDMVFDQIDDNTFQAGTLLDGKYILDTFFNDDVDMRYTSATFRFVNDTTFSYKRFPVRSLSRLIDVQIIWRFTLINAYDYECPEEE